MDTFSFRSLLYLVMYLGWAAAGLSCLASLAWFLRPAFSVRGRAALAGGLGTVEVEAGRTSGEGLARAVSWAALLACALTFAVNFAALLARYHEVRHWPAQTMYEVIPLGTAAGALSSLVLYFVLGLQRMRGMARGFGDLLQGLVFVGIAITVHYVLGLDPTGRPLPPALQSYWFPTHISAYMFGYFTFFIATLATWLYFCFRLWRGVLEPAHRVGKAEVLGVLVFSLAVVPFGRMGLLLGPGILLLTFLVALVSRAIAGNLSWFEVWEQGADSFTWRIFLVGFPFLTAGLIQGALWAQEAWAIYWGWDSKEVSALISWLFYAVYLHLRFVGGWRGRRGMWILLFGGISVYITFQLFGMLPASQSSLHRYTDMDVVPAEGLMEPPAG